MNFQIGKNGLTEGTLNSLKLAFKNHKTIRISVLRSQSPTKNKVLAMSKEIIEKLGGEYRVNIIGFTIILSKKKNIK